MKAFLTFGGGSNNYHDAVDRIMQQADALGVFDQTFGYKTNDIMSDESFWSKHSAFIKSHRRGWGYWIWKPYLIHKQMSAMKDGDILLYLDSGCEIDVRQRDIIHQLFEFVQTDMLIGTYTGNPEKNWGRAHSHATRKPVDSLSSLVSLISRICRTDCHVHGLGLVHCGKRGHCATVAAQGSEKWARRIGRVCRIAVAHHVSVHSGADPGYSHGIYSKSCAFTLKKIPKVDI